MTRPSAARQSILSDTKALEAKLVATKVVYSLPRFAWYDNQFISKFEAAQRFLQIIAPERLETFVAAFDVLRTRPDFTVAELPELLDQDRLTELQQELKAVPKEAFDSSENNSHGRDVLRDHPSLTALQSSLIGLVSDLAGEPVEPYYNFVSLYRADGKCLPHMDEPSAKWTLDLCIDQNCEWPIWFSRIVPWPTAHSGGDHRPEDVRADASLEFKSFTMRPGNAILFSGSSQWHYRDQIPEGGFCHLAFLHYRPAGTDALSRPEVWQEYFDVPALAVLNAVYDDMRPLKN